jgi:acetoin utilization protein AcuB
MLVADFMTRRVITITPETTMVEAVRLLESHDIRRMIVVRDRSVVGILTDGDVLRACPADLNPFSAMAAEDPVLKRTVGGCMTSPVETILSDSPLEQAAGIFVEKKIGALPVMSGDSLVGIITESDTLRALITLLGTGAGIRVTFNVHDEDEDVFAFVHGLSRRHKMKVAALLSHERAGHRVVLVRLLGMESPGLMEEIWSSGHRVISVARL